MAAGTILVAHESRALMERAAEGLRQKPDAPQVVSCEDGAIFLTQFTRMARAGQPPRLCVLDSQPGAIAGTVVALSARAVERGLGLPPTAFLFYTAEAATDDFKALLSRVGRAVHLQRSVELPIEEQGRRLTIAVEKLLVQLGSR